MRQGSGLPVLNSLYTCVVTYNVLSNKLMTRIEPNLVCQDIRQGHDGDGDRYIGDDKFLLKRFEEPWSL